MFDKTVDKVLASLNKAMTDLDSVSLNKLMAVEDSRNKIDELTMKMAADRAEADRAVRVRERLKELIA